MKSASYTQDFCTVSTKPENGFSQGALSLALSGIRLALIAAAMLWVVLFISPLAIRWVGWDMYAVRGASMEPTISPGSLALTRAVPTEDLGTGEIIVFPAPWAQAEGKPRLIIHRLVQLVPTGEGLQGITEGDGNGVLDPAPTHLGIQVPVVVATVPLLGSVYTFVHGWGVSIALAASLSVLGMSALAHACSRRGYSSPRWPWPVRRFLPFSA